MIENKKTMHGNKSNRMSDAEIMVILPASSVSDFIALTLARYSLSYYFCIMKYMYASIGFVSVVLGIIGIFLPVLPTTPFLLLAAAMFFRGSPRAYLWLMNHPRLGPYIKSFREDKSIPLRIKIIAISTLWLTAIHCSLFIFPWLWLKLAMILLATAITIYILSFKTRRR